MPNVSTGASVVLAVLVSCVPSAAFDPKPVKSVELLGAEAPSGLETQAGQTLDPAKLRNDVKALWRTGRFSDIRADTVEDGDAVRVVFRVQPKRFARLRKILVKPPTPGVNPQVAAGSPIDAYGAQQIGESVRKQLETSGFPFVKVEASLLPVKMGEADVEVRIDQGQRINIDNVVLTGDLGQPGTNPRKALKWTSSKTILPRVPGIWSGWRIRPGFSHDAVDYDAANLRSFYYARGYFDADIRGESADIATGKSKVHFHVQAGPRYAIREFTLRGAEGDRQMRPLADGTFPVRDVCNALLDERRKAELTGVLDFSAAIDVKPIDGTAVGGRKWADLTATITKGRTYRVGRIEFRGNHSFGDLTVRRAMLLAEGDLLDETLLRKSLARLNNMGFFEPLSQADVVVNTPPGSDRADLTIQLRERKMRHWIFSGPAGPMSVGGPLTFAVGSRLPAWGRHVLELSTYTVSMNLMFFAKPLGSILPGLPNQRLFPALTIQRPLLPGQRWLSGFVLTPQLGWQGLLMGYGFSQGRGLLDPIFESPRAYTPALSVTIANKGTLYCEPAKTKMDWLRQIGGTATKAAFSFVPF